MPPVLREAAGMASGVAVGISGGGQGSGVRADMIIHYSGVGRFYGEVLERVIDRSNVMQTYGPDEMRSRFWQLMEVLMNRGDNHKQTRENTHADQAD